MTDPRPLPEGLQEQAHRLLLHPAAERQAALSALCLQHPEQAQALRTWLEAQPDPKAAEAPSVHTEASAERMAHLRGWLQDPDQRYTLRGEVGRGGMGAVFKVRDASLGRHLAMKVIRLEGDEDSTPANAVDPRVLERFLEEAQITGQLDHPGIVPVHELGVDARGRAYFTMKLVHGRTADEVFAQARAGEEGWSRTRALEVLVKVCDALAFAHQKGVIHRDLKPANVMVGKFGEVYVMDWGLAKVLGQNDSRDLRVRPEDSASRSRVRTDRSQQAESDPDSPLVTMDGAVVGTPSYMPPEQAEGRVEALGPQSDVYAVGAMLYTLLTGWVPYVKPGTKASPYTILRWVRESAPQPVHAIDPTVPAELVAICAKAMAREPKDRYPDMRALGEDLRAYLESRVVKAHRTGAVAELAMWVRRNRGLAAALAAAALLLVAGIAVSLHLARSANIAKAAELSAKEDAQRDALAAGVARDLAQEQSRRARRQAYLASLWAADANLRSHEVAEARSCLEACEPELRGFEWQHLWFRSDSSVGRMPREGSDAILVGGKFLGVDSDRMLRAWDPASLAPLGVVGGPVQESSCSVISLGSDTRVGVVTGDWRFLEYSLAPFHMAREIRLDGEWRARVVSDGRRLFVAGYHSDCHLVSWSLADGTPTKVPFPRPPKSLLDVSLGLLGRKTDESARTVAVSPDGSLLCTGGWVAIYVWDPSTWKLLHVMGGHEDEVTALAFHPKGRILVSGAADRSLRVWEIGKSEPLSVRRGLSDAPAALAVSPDGEHIVSGSRDGAIQIWKCRLERGETGDALATLLGHTGAVTSVSVTGDSQRIVSSGGDGVTRLWDLHLGRPTTDLGEEDSKLRKEKLRALRIVAGGRLFVALLRDRVRVLAADSGRCVRTWRSAVTMTLSHDATARRVARCESRPELTALGTSPGTAVVALACGDPAVRLLDCDSGEIVGSLGPHAGVVQHVAMSGDGKRVAAVAADQLHLWDVDRRQSLLVFRLDRLAVSALALAPAGDRVAVAARNGQILWGREGGDHLVPMPQDQTHPAFAGAHSLEWSPDGRRLFASHGADLQAWDVDQGKLLATLTGHAETVEALASSPDGRRLFSGARDGRVRIWEMDTFACVGTLRGKPRDSVLSVAITPDGRRLVTGTAEGPQVWESEVSRDRIRARRNAVTDDLKGMFTAVVLAQRQEPLAAKLEAIAANPEIALPERESTTRALVEMAVVNPQFIERSHSAGWQLQPDSPPRMWQRAELLARQARVLAPDSGLLLTDMGMAQFRLGRCEEALATLQRAEQMNSAAIAGGLPEDAALLAMTCARLGRRDDAQAWRARLARSMELPGLVGDLSLLSLRREVDDMLAR